MLRPMGAAGPTSALIQVPGAGQLLEMAADAAAGHRAVIDCRFKVQS
jgi:hypothetical protein